MHLRMVYHNVASVFCDEAGAAEVSVFALGDLFLKEVRQYRIDLPEGTDVKPVFPLWKVRSRELAEEMISPGLRTRLTCIDPRILPRRFAGRDFDLELLAEIPPDVDSCGENEEFHTFAFSGPMSRPPLSISSGHIEERDGLVFADVVPHPPGNDR